jgi:hypothetical protein
MASSILHKRCKQTERTELGISNDHHKAPKTKTAEYSKAKPVCHEAYSRVGANIDRLFRRAFGVLCLMILHNRLDARLLDQMAQPHQHGETEYRGCADPSRLRRLMFNVNVNAGRHDCGRAVQYYCPSSQSLCVKGVKRTAICHGM